MTVTQYLVDERILKADNVVQSKSKVQFEKDLLVFPSGRLVTYMVGHSVDLGHCMPKVRRLLFP